MLGYLLSLSVVEFSYADERETELCLGQRGEQREVHLSRPFRFRFVWPILSKKSGKELRFSIILQLFAPVYHYNKTKFETKFETKKKHNGRA